MNPFDVAPSTLPDLMQRLTPRQLEIVELLAQGKSYPDIATLLSVSTDAIKGHVQRACQKMQLDNRIQLVVVFTMWHMSENGGNPVTNPNV